jgi:membrane protease YdiL (CAAX protease family)
MGRKDVILQLAIFTLVAMPLVAILFDRYTETVNLAAALVGNTVWWLQLIIGTLFGFVAAVGAQFIIERPFMQKVHVKYSSVLGNFQLTWSEIILISVCAGVGEELLFRGAIQPFAGIVFTAIAFVAIHGYLNPRDWRMSVYGVYMSLVIVTLGFFAERMGLLSAIAAHTAIDIYLLYKMNQNPVNLSEQVPHEF